MLTGFQLRSAKAVLDFTARDIAKNIFVHYNTLTRLGHTPNLECLKCNSKTLILLKNFFELENLIFIDGNTIALHNRANTLLNIGALTRFQLKVARSASGLTQEELGSCVKLSSSSISAMENIKNTNYVGSTKLDILRMKRYFEHIGITFPNDLSVSLTKDPRILLKK